jgi:hypothetical protein
VLWAAGLILRGVDEENQKEKRNEEKLFVD